MNLDKIGNIKLARMNGLKDLGKPQHNTNLLSVRRLADEGRGLQACPPLPAGRQAWREVRTYYLT